MKLRQFEDRCGCFGRITPCSVNATRLHGWYSDLPLICPIALWSGIEGRGGSTGPIVCRGEGVAGVRRFGLLEGGSPLWMERKWRRAGQSQPPGIRVELEWPTPRIRCLPNRAQWVSSPGPSLWGSGLMDSPKCVMLDTLTLFPQGALLLHRKSFDVSYDSLANYPKVGLGRPPAATLIFSHPCVRSFG